MDDIGNMSGVRVMPIPAVMTEDELIAFLKLDQTAVGDPGRTLRYYRDQGLLRGTQIGRRVRYLAEDVLDFLRTLRERNRR